MNLIVCAKDCKHQCDGYCALDNMKTATNCTSTECCYYDKIEPTQKPSTPSMGLKENNSPIS